VIVVADTTPLNYLILMRETGLLKVLYNRVLVPAAVLAEMLAAGAPLEVRTWASQPPGWVDVVSPVQIDSTLPVQLGSGEREAISLALERHADVVLMDDQPARLVAEERGLFVSGTLSVVLQASRLGLLDFEAAIALLKALGFRVSAEVETRMRTLAQHPVE
jgi:predicted nucleic acid-binding protein